MTDEKKWWKSGGVVSGLTVIALLLLRLAGMNTEGLEVPIGEVIILGLTLAAALMGIRGRVKANTKIERKLI